MAGSYKLSVLTCSLKVPGLIVLNNKDIEHTCTPDTNMKPTVRMLSDTNIYRPFQSRPRDNIQVLLF